MLVHCCRLTVVSAAASAAAAAAAVLVWFHRVSGLTLFPFVAILCLLNLILCYLLEV